MREDSSAMAILARTILVAAISALAVASLAPSGFFPKVLYSYHLEHFAAFYGVTLAMAAGRYRAGVYRLLLDAGLLASVLEGVRLFTPLRQLYVAQDWVSDVGGAMAALAPIAIADFRRSFERGPADKDIS
jgi:hypothetical protein